MFYKCLCLHPDAGWISNWVARHSRFPQLSALNRLTRRFPPLQDRAWFDAVGNAYVYGKPRPALVRAIPAPVEGEPVFARAGLGAAPGADAALRRAVAAMTRWSGGRTFVSKRIANNRRVAALVTAFPGARFLHVVRDGRAVARSLGQVDWWETSVVSWYGGTPSDWRAGGGDPIELCARTWVEEVAAVEAGLRDIPASHRMVARYEDAIADPGATMAKVAQFAGLRSDARWLARVERRLAQRALPPAPRVDAEALRIEAVQREQLEAFGYALAGA